jgi:hypothetical protein
MNTTKLHWTTLGVLACTLLTGASLQTHAASTRVTLIASDPSALVGTSTGSFTLIRNGETNDDLSVDVAISGTAANGVDYSTISNTLTIPAGFMAVDVPVQPILDTANRGNKTVVLTLQSNANYTFGGLGRATVKIVDDIYDIPPPTVSITSPTDGSVFTAPAAFTIQAAVSDPNLPIQSVSFYANDDFLGRVTAPPYSLTVTNVKAGKYAYFVRAVDEFGKSAVSEVVHVTVSATPVVTLVSLEGNVINLGDLVPLQAQFADTNEAISKVVFYQGTNVLGTVTSAPFIFNWPANNSGIFTFHAVATDQNTGKKGTSPTLQLNVTPGGGA